MVLAVGFLLLVSLIVSALLAGAFKYFGGLIPVPEFVMHIVEFVVSLLVLTGLFGMMFAILPSARLGWRDVEFGAASTALLFTVGKLAIGMYVGKTISVSDIRCSGVGDVGGRMGLLLGVDLLLRCGTHASVRDKVRFDGREPTPADRHKAENKGGSRGVRIEPYLVATLSRPTGLMYSLSLFRSRFPPAVLDAR